MAKQKEIHAMVMSSDGQHIGRVVGPDRPCRMEGCTGATYPVRWPDGKLTNPCTKGMVFMGRIPLWRIMK